MQAPGGPTEAPTKGFKFGGWVINLVTQGSTELVHALLANDLVDAMTLFTVPVVLGGGKKLFADGSAPHAYKPTRSRFEHGNHDRTLRARWCNQDRRHRSR